MNVAIWNLSTSQGSDAQQDESHGDTPLGVRLLRQLPVWVLAALAYFAAAWLGYKWATIQGIGSAIWPAISPPAFAPASVLSQHPPCPL